MPLLSALAQQISNPQLFVIVVSTTRELDRIQLALESLNPDAQIVQFPAWETLPHERQSPSADIVGARYEVLHQLKQWQTDPTTDFFLLTPARGALQQIGPFLGTVEPIRLTLGESD